VGHETDFTIADFAAALRAATPTAAATLVTPDVRQLRAAVAALATAAQERLGLRLDAARHGLRVLAARAARVAPDRRLAQQRQRIDDLAHRAGLAITHRLRRRRSELAGVRLHLAALDPMAVLARGYAIVSTPAGAVIMSAGQAAPGDPLHVRLADGEIDVRVLNEP
jgi:exodeoxyribonuclease VII large subunit